MTATPSAAARQIRSKLQALPAALGPSERWRKLVPAEYPALFQLLDVAADLPRLAGHRTFASSVSELWPELAAVGGEVAAVQALVDHPAVPEGTRTASCRTLAEIDDAVREIEQDRCTHVDFFFEADQHQRLEALAAELFETRTPEWGELSRESSPRLFELFEEGLASERFRRLTGFDLERDEYTLTLSRQNLDRAGIGWPRDLYWPRQWVGEDVFGVLYGLTSDTPEQGGAFLYWLPEHAEVRAFYRQRHQATVIWNGRANAERPFHAVSERLPEHRAGHHFHLQCRRRNGESGQG